MNGQPDHRDSRSKPAPRKKVLETNAGVSSSGGSWKMPSRPDELRSLRHPSAPSFVTSGRAISSHLDKKTSSAGFKSTLGQEAGPSASTERESVHNTTYDKKMAARQTRIATLPPKEREEQDVWARSKINEMPTKCAAGFDYVRNNKLGGYQCTAGAHLVTDALLSEGKGGYMIYGRYRKGIWDGPEYPRIP